MIQFTQEEQKRIQYRGRKQQGLLLKLKDGVKPVMEGNLLVPKTGITNWSHYYYCPDCSVKLIFDRNSPKEHVCPCCKQVFQGEPYDGAWWELVNGENFKAAYQMAIIWLATGEERYARKASQILEEYARNYPNYQVHGNIPYNGPGRAGAQTLDEANFLRSFALAYDILTDYMTEDARKRVREDMMLPGAQFLMEHRHKQLHNHEVIINSAIAVIGILFSKEDYIKAALYEKYGLYDQLEHGMLEDHMWFEGSFGYHFYALTSFLAFEKFALHTPYSGIRHPNYRYMLELPFAYLQPDGRIPMLNDTNYGHFPGIKELYEFSYRELGGEKLAYLLKAFCRMDGTAGRENLEAFLYGADDLPEPRCKAPVSHYHTEVGKPGHTILRGKDGRYLLIKHDRYGGEHDHYDRLGISYYAYGHPVISDLGTTGYGAKLHYDYYKNTGSHNTMVIGEENQAPVDGRLTRYEQRDNAVYVETEADWAAPYQMPDSFTIRQWSEENYRPVRMARKIIWTENYFIEIFLAEQIPDGKTADWVIHVNGKEVKADLPDCDCPERNSGTGVLGRVAAPAGYFVKKPFCHLKNVMLAGSQPEEPYARPCDKAAGRGTYQRVYQRVDEKDSTIFTSVWGMDNGQVLIDATGPDNPSTKEIAYLIERRTGSSALSAHLIESWKDAPSVRQVQFEQGDGQMEILVWEADGRQKRFSIGNDK